MLNSKIGKLSVLLVSVLLVMLSACRNQSVANDDRICSEGKAQADAGNFARAFSIWGEQSLDASSKMHLRAALECLEATGIVRDQRAAAVWIVDKAEAGVVPAQLFSGLLFLAGTGVESDARTGLDWLQKAEDAGSEAAAFLRRELERQTPESSQED